MRGNKRHKAPEALTGGGSRHRGTASIVLLPPDARREVPPCPRGLTKLGRGWYAAFCRDPISQLVTPAGWGKVQRLAVLLSKREVVERRIWKDPLTKGSMEQDTMNPLLALQKELTREIETIEERLGVTPADQLRLGIKLGQAREAGARAIRAQLDAEAGATPARRDFGGEGG